MPENYKYLLRKLDLNFTTWHIYNENAQSQPKYMRSLGHWVFQFMLEFI